MCRTKTEVGYLDDEDDYVLSTATEERMVRGAVNWHADVQKTGKNLFGLGQSKINVLGRVRATMAVGEVSSDQDPYVVVDLKEPLLERLATEVLKLIERFNAVDNDQYRKEFP